MATTITDPASRDSATRDGGVRASNTTVPMASTSVEADYQRLVDPRFGVVVGLHPKVPDIDEPAALVSFHGRVCDARKLGQWYGDRISLGTAFYDAEQARRAAIGEAVERYCGNFVPRTLRKASYNALRAAGEDAVDPASLALYADTQYAARGFPFVRFTRSLEVFWAPGRALTRGTPAWVPASLVYPNYFVDALAHEPKTHFVNLAGIAAGVGREDAERAALEEVIERDAVTLWWLADGPCRPLSMDETRVRAAMLPAATEDPKPLRYFLFAIDNVFGIPVIGALMRDPKHDLVAVGFACRPNPVDAALKALAEAVHLRGYSREMLEPDGKIWQLIESGVFDRRVYKPYRRDRLYRDDFRTDYRDIVDLGCHAQIYLDPRMEEHLGRFDTAGPEQPISSVPALDFGLEIGTDLRAAYLDRLAAQGLEAYSVDATTPDVASSGLSVVRVIVPGMVGNAPAAFPPLGGARLYQDPVRLGWRDDPLPPEDVVLAPIPHT